MTWNDTRGTNGGLVVFWSHLICHNPAGRLAPQGCPACPAHLIQSVQVLIWFVQLHPGHATPLVLQACLLDSVSIQLISFIQLIQNITKPVHPAIRWIDLFLDFESACLVCPMWIFCSMARELIRWLSVCSLVASWTCSWYYTAETNHPICAINT